MKSLRYSVMMAALTVLCFFDPGLESAGAVGTATETTDAAPETAAETASDAEEASDAASGDFEGLQGDSDEISGSRPADGDVD